MAVKDTGITQTNGATVITGDGIAYFQLLSIRGRLKLEIAGIRFKGPNTLKSVNAIFGQNFKTKKAALEFIEEKVVEWKREHTA
jgi:hypothetical protein